MDPIFYLLLLLITNITGRQFKHHHSRYLPVDLNFHQHRSKDFLLHLHDVDEDRRVKMEDSKLLEMLEKDIEREKQHYHKMRHQAKGLHPDIHWPVKKEAEVEGEIVLGGLMMVHEREDSITCGPVMPQGGIQALEAMLYTLDRINANPILLPNITIGAHILDDCDKDTYGLEIAVDFIKGR